MKRALILVMILTASLLRVRAGGRKRGFLSKQGRTRYNGWRRHDRKRRPALRFRARRIPPRLPTKIFRLWKTELASLKPATGNIARDSQGRTRQDASLPAIGNLSAADAPHLVFIQDPVAQTAYTLNLTDKTAQKMPVASREHKHFRPERVAPAKS